MLEKNRDNLMKALPGFVKFQLTQGETVSNGFYYTAFIPNVQPAQLLQPFLDYAFGFRRGVEHGPAAGQRRPARRTRQRSPAQRHPWRITMNRRPWVIGAAIALAVLLVAGAAFVVRQTVYAPKKIDGDLHDRHRDLPR